jgi:diguanylate cyclase (GGDEF)-like protein/PAS domain S-box-containing protein
MRTASTTAQRPSGNGAAASAEILARFSGLEVADTLTQAVLVADIAGTVVYANPAAEALHGWTLADAGCVLPREAFGPVMSIEELSAVRCLVDSGTTWSGDVLMKHRDGTTIPTHISLSPLFDGDALIGTMIVEAEPTEAASIREQMQASEQFLALQRNTADVAIIFESDGVMRYVSPSITEATGYLPEDLVGKRGWEFVHPDDLDAGVIAVTEPLAEGRTAKLEWRLLAADGSWRWYEQTVSDLTSDPAIGGIVATLRDVTERRLADDSLRLGVEESLGQAEKFRRIFDESPVGKVTVNASLIITDVNQSLATYLGYDASALVGLPVTSLIEPDEQADQRLKWIALFAGEVERFGCEAALVKSDGDVVIARINATVIDDEAGAPQHGIAAVVDITEIVRSYEAHAESDLVLRRTIEAATDAFVGIDEAGLVTDWNPAAGHLFGWSYDEAVGQPAIALLVPDEDKTMYRSGFKQLVRGGSYQGPAAAIEATMLDRGGRRIPVELSLASVLQHGKMHLKAFIRDNTARKDLEAQLIRQALHDPLTELPNRALLRDRLGRAISGLAEDARGEDGSMIAVLFVDIDRFKVVNDGLGSEAGDEMLRLFAARLKTITQPSDTVARFGGDEFVVVSLVAGGASQAVLLGKRILRTLAEPVTLSGRELLPTVSVGIAFAACQGATPDSLVQDASVAMYQAKELGGNTYELFDTTMRNQALHRLELEEGLRQAIDQRELRVFFQPVVTYDGIIREVEALVRWQHPVLGLVPPNDFVPLAEETGLVIPLGRLVLDLAARQVAKWRKTVSPSLRLSVNISARQLSDPGLASTVSAVLSETNLDPGALCLEITETCLMKDPVRAAESLAELRSLGVTLAVDDFGTGYSSLLYLRQFPVDVLKLDRVFVSGLGTNPRDDVMVGSIIDLAHSLGLVAVAEGVETLDQLGVLEELGCDYGQGFYWSEPLAAEELESLLDTSLPSSPE